MDIKHHIETWDEHNTICVYAMKNNNVIGKASIMINETFSELCSFYVLPEYRKQGIGIQILNYLESLYVVYNIQDNMYLRVNSLFSNLIIFYSFNNFKIHNYSDDSKKYVWMKYEK